MKISKHASIRAAQRAINDYQILLISIFGTPIMKDKECNKIIIPDKIIDRIRYSLDKCKGKALIVDNEYKNIVTAYSMYR